MSKKDIKVSVLTPLYNHDAKYVRQCLDSLCAQTLKECEFILIDNGANEENKALIAEYLEKDSRFRVLHFEKNQGYGKAMNSGLDSAKGEYIGIVESDDYIEAKMYEKLYNVAKNNNVKFAKCLFRQIICDKKDTNSYPRLKQYNKKFDNIDVPELILNCHISQWAAIYLTSFLQDNGIRWSIEKGATAQDISFVLKVFCLSKTLFVIDDTFYNYRIDNSNSSIKALDSNAWGCLKEYNLLIDWLKTKNISRDLWCIVFKRAYQNLIMAYKDRITRRKLLFVLNMSRVLKKEKDVFKYFNKNDVKIFKKIAKRPLKFWFKSLNINFFSNFLISVIKKDNEYKLKLFGLTIIHKKDALNKKYLKLFGILCYFSKNKVKKAGINLNDILLINNKINELSNKDDIILKLINNKINELSNKDDIILKQINLIYDKIDNWCHNLKVIIEAQNLHKKTFGPYKNAFEGKDVVLVCTGPTAKSYKPIKNAIHVGVNGAIYLDNIFLDYLFIQDYTVNQKNNNTLNIDANRYIGNNCKKFYGIIPDNRLSVVHKDIERIPHICTYNANISEYLLEDIYMHNIAQDLSREPIGDFSGTPFSALQFILYCNPKRLFLVGWDCGAGYAYGKENAMNPANYQVNIVKKYFVPFIEYNNPQLEVISINPVGLKGVFKDIYRKEYDNEFN